MLREGVGGEGKLKDRRKKAQFLEVGAIGQRAQVEGKRYGLRKQLGSDRGTSRGREFTWKQRDSCEVGWAQSGSEAEVGGGLRE